MAEWPGKYVWTIHSLKREGKIDRKAHQIFCDLIHKVQEGNMTT